MGELERTLKWVNERARADVRDYILSNVQPTPDWSQLEELAQEGIRVQNVDWYEEYSRGIFKTQGSNFKIVWLACP